MKLSIYQLKPKFQRLLAPMLAMLVRLQITPNQVTLFAMGLSVLFGISLAMRPNHWELWAIFPFFMLLRMALNAIDGMLANYTNNKTRLGALLNELADQVSDACLYLPFAAVGGIHVPLLLITVIAALLTEFAGVCAILVGAARRFDGPMGKSDRAFAFGLLALLVALGIPAFWLNALLALILLLSGWTILNRLHSALAQAQV